MDSFKKLALAFLAAASLTACSSSRTHKAGDMAGNVDNSLVSDFEKNVGDRVFFGYDSSALNKDAKAKIQHQAKWLKEHQNLKVTVEGHCDERGTEEYNMGLGERRADAAKNQLVKDGLDASRVDTISYGKQRPAVIGNNEEAWKQNRRAVTTLRQ